MGSQLKGGVGITNADSSSDSCCYGDIVSFQADGDYYSVKLRGVTDTDGVVSLPRKNLVELRTMSEMHCAREGFRDALLKQAAAQKDDPEEWLQERVQTIELNDQFTYLVLHHTNPVGFDPHPDEVQRQALVRYLEAFNVGHAGLVDTNGRGLTSFHMALAPFYSNKGGAGRFERRYHRLVPRAVPQKHSIRGCEHYFSCLFFRGASKGLFR